MLPISSLRRQPVIPDECKESRHLAEDQRHVALTRNISYLIWGRRPRPFFPRSFSMIGFSLDFAFISRAKTKQSRLSSNSASLTRSNDSVRANVSNYRATRDQPCEGGAGRDRSYGSTRRYRRAIYRARTQGMSAERCGEYAALSSVPSTL